MTTSYFRCGVMGMNKPVKTPSIAGPSILFWGKKTVKYIAYKLVKEPEEIGIRDGSSKFKTTGLEWYSVILNANKAWKVATRTGLEQIQPRGQDPDGITDLLG